VTPYEIEIILHYFCFGSKDHPDISRNPPVWRPTIDGLCSSGILACVEGLTDVAYRITEKGAAYVEHVCAVQVPVCKWVQPPGGNALI